MRLLMLLGLLIGVILVRGRRSSRWTSRIISPSKIHLLLMMLRRQLLLITLARLRLGEDLRGTFDVWIDMDVRFLSRLNQTHILSHVLVVRGLIPLVVLLHCLLSLQVQPHLLFELPAVQILLCLLRSIGCCCHLCWSVRLRLVSWTRELASQKLI